MDLNISNDGEKKVTVITLQNVRNYGSALQALATQEIFKSLCCQVDFINYVRKDIVSPVTRIKKWCKGMNSVKKLIYGCILYPSFVRQNKVFTEFLNQYLNVIPTQYTTNEDFKNFPVTSDIYCTGSDQTWNSAWNDGILPPLFLSFVPDNVRKIAYAASFGKSKLDDWEKQETKDLLKRYYAISVRESSGVDIIKELGLPEATHVLDPTLQVDRSFWKQYVGKRKIAQPYVLVYQLNTNKAFDNYAKEFASRKGLRLVRFCTRIDQIIKCGKALIVPEVLDFVSAIYYADTVITDSFHATAFSINMNTSMICIYPHEFGGRIASILKLTGLESRHLTSYSDFSFVDTPQIDFKPVNDILNRERKKGWNFLKQAIR